MPTLRIRLELLPEAATPTQFQVEVPGPGETWTPVYVGPGAPLPAPPEPAPVPQAPGTTIFEDGFENGLGAWTQEPPTGRYAIETDPARVKSGAHSLRILFTPSNGYGMLHRRFLPGYDECFVRFAVLFEPGFVNRRADGNEMHFLTIAGNRIDNPSSSYGTAGRRPTGTDFFYAGVDPERAGGALGPLGFYTYHMNMPGTYGQNFSQAPSKVPLVPGTWQDVLYHIKLNTPGQADGSQTLTLNGQLKLAVNGMRWRTTTDLRVNQVRFDSYMPGGAKTQHIWVDDVRVWRP